ncbi:MAG: hypothetical protein ABIH38_04625 [Patescibacteria group bacterium]
MPELEIEKVYLLKQLPEDLANFKFQEARVGYFFDPNARDALRIRKKGDKYELIKKETNSAYERVEHTINIKKGEFDVLIKSAVRSYEKHRYNYPFKGHVCEIDVYLGKLIGYARVEVEFKNIKELKNFVPPVWFGDEITKINHKIHEDIGLVTFEDMKERYKEKGITLKKIDIK